MKAKRFTMLVTAKTYPTLSSRHNEVVCTAGITNKGAMMRIYPICYRSLPKEQRSKKYQWIAFKAVRDLRDPRIESYRLAGNINILEAVTIQKEWLTRKSFVLKDVRYNIKDIITRAYDKTKYQSLVVFKPQIIKKFIVKNTTEIDKLDRRREILTQTLKKGECLAEELPYKFFYTFTDLVGRESTLQILDWEIYQLARKLMRIYGNDSNQISKILRKKYFEEIAVNRDVFFFLGTNKYWHIRRSKNPFMIIGVFYPPKTNQKSIQNDPQNYTCGGPRTIPPAGN
jgi:hypothetical protein